ncbi:peptidoglycan-binding domain-containing protein [Streptomyces sp. NPDC054995]
MRFRLTRSHLAVAAVTTAVAGALAFGTAPASASISSGYVSGGGTFTNDWGDEGVISQSSYAKSNATCLWQQILWAEGAKEQDGTAYDAADIDGHFGANTTHATKNLQDRWPLKDVDGKVGNATWGYADGKLSFYDYAHEYAFGGQILRYSGSARSFYLVRAANGNYVFWEGSTNDNGKYRFASYKSRNCS